MASAEDQIKALGIVGEYLSLYGNKNPLDRKMLELATKTTQEIRNVKVALENDKMTLTFGTKYQTKL